MLGRFGSEPLPNKGSRARDHLANERTFLAWIRTSLGGLALAIALDRFDPQASDAGTTLLAVVLIVVSVAGLLFATRRYYAVERELEAGNFEVDRTGPITVLIAIGTVALLALVVALL